MPDPRKKLGYREIASDLRRRLPDLRARGVAKLPTQEELAEQHRVSVTTIRRAIDVLEREGLVDRIRRRGTLIRSTPRLHYRRGVERYAKSLWRFGKTPPSRFDRMEPEDADGADESEGSWSPSDQTQTVTKVPADSEVAEAFGIPDGTVVWERARLVKEDGRPTHTLTSYYLPEHVDGTPLVSDRPGPSSDGGGFQVLALMGHEPDHIRETLNARMPTPEEREDLSIPEGEPVILLRRHTFTADDELIEFARGVHRASNFAWVYDFKIPDDV